MPVREVFMSVAGIEARQVQAEPEEQKGML